MAVVPGPAAVVAELVLAPAGHVRAARDPLHHTAAALALLVLVLVLQQGLLVVLARAVVGPQPTSGAELFSALLTFAHFLVFLGDNVALLALLVGA